MDTQQQEHTKKTYVCMGSCQAVISEEQYMDGLTKCGAEVCTMKGQPFFEGKRSEETGKNEASQSTAN
jgi:hypothetical protein